MTGRQTRTRNLSGLPVHRLLSDPGGVTECSGLNHRPAFPAHLYPPWIGGNGGGTPRQKSQKSGQQSEMVRLQKRSQ